jgi:hypothetical protein
VHHPSDTPSAPPASGPRRRRGPAPRGRGRPGSRWLAWAGVLGGLLLVVAAAVTPPTVAAAPAAGCGRPICQPLAFVQLSLSQSYQGSSIAVSGGKVLLNSTDNTVTPDAPAQTNLYVLALPES